MHLLNDTDADDTVDLAQGLDSVLGGGVVQVQHGVGVLAAAAVEHIRNIDIGLGHNGGELAQGVGDISVEDRNTAGLGTDAHIVSVFSLKFRLSVNTSAWS